MREAIKPPIARNANQPCAPPCKTSLTLTAKPSRSFDPAAGSSRLTPGLHPLIPRVKRVHARGDVAICGVHFVDRFELLDRFVALAHFFERHPQEIQNL